MNIIYSKVYILYNSNYWTFWKRQNFGDSKIMSDFHGWGGRRNEQSEH
jgi:hypothetical protein